MVLLHLRSCIGVILGGSVAPQEVNGWTLTRGVSSRSKVQPSTPGDWRRPRTMPFRTSSSVWSWHVEVL